MERKITRTRGGNYCTVEIVLKDGRLSVCGEEGRVITRKMGREEALAYWVSYFEESPEEIASINKRFNKRFTSEKGAAKFVLETDGEFHGLDMREAGDKLYTIDSCGQIRETIVKFFPEVQPLMKWHLNDMKAGCEHQDELGWGHGKTIALAADDLTEAQRSHYETASLKVCEGLREAEFKARWQDLRSSEAKASVWLRSHNGGTCTADLLNTFMSTGKFVGVVGSKDLRACERWLKEDITRDIKPIPFDAAIYKDSLGAPCPTCGYAYGSEWLKRELPPEIVQLAMTVCEKEEVAA